MPKSAPECAKGSKQLAVTAAKLKHKGLQRRTLTTRSKRYFLNPCGFLNRFTFHEHQGNYLLFIFIFKQDLSFRISSRWKIIIPWPYFVWRLKNNTIPQIIRGKQKLQSIIPQALSYSSGSEISGSFTLESREPNRFEHTIHLPSIPTISTLTSWTDPRLSHHLGFSYGFNNRWFRWRNSTFGSAYLG